MQPAIRVSDLAKCYRLVKRPIDRLWDALMPAKWQRGQAFWAVKGVSFEAHARETVGIIGTNGSGKSTLLQMLAGTLQPTRGQVHTRGRVSALLELGAGFNPELTGRENARLGAAIHGVQAADLERVCAKIHEFADIGEFIDQPVKNYSSGMFVRLAFAVIAHVDADVMIVDEALSVGDAYFAQKCARFFDAFKAKGTIVLVSHDLGTVKALCDRVVWMERGDVRAQGDPKSVVDAYLKHLYAKDQTVDVGSVSPAPTPAMDRAQVPDVRLATPVSATAWNAIKAFSFDGTNSFGAGKAKIDGAYFTDVGGQRLEDFAGFQEVQLVINAHAVVAIEEPVFGFFVRNRAGVNLFGDNTFLRLGHAVVGADAGTRLRGVFRFVMPSLPKGEYSVSVALACGSNTQHEQQHWVNDAIMIQSTANDVHADVLGIPMLDMQVEAMAA